MAVDPITDMVYVVAIANNTRSGTVLEIDGATNTVSANIAVGTVPNAVAVDPTTDMVYVVNDGSNTVSVIDGATSTVTATIPVGSSP